MAVVVTHIIGEGAKVVKGGGVTTHVVGQCLMPWEEASENTSENLSILSVEYMHTFKKKL